MLIFNNKGIEAPDTSEVIASFESLLRGVFGATVNLNPQTLNGLLIQELTNQQVINITNILSLFNQYSLYTATGISLDNIGYLYNVIRTPGSYTSINIEMTGAPGTAIPTATEVSDGTYTFYSIQSYVIGSTGSTVGEYQANIFSNYVPTIHTVKNLISFVPGLEKVTNTGVGDVAGSIPETDADYSKRIPKEAFDSQRGTYRSLESALTKISRDFIIKENFTDNPITDSGIDIPAHSLWISSNDGSDSDIANAIFDYKSLGCGLVGTQVFSIDGYEIKFNRPTIVMVDFLIEVVTVPSQPPDLISLIQLTILNFTQNISKIGATLYSSEFIAELDRVGVVQIEYITINEKTSVDSEITQLLSTTIDRITVQVVEG